MAFSRVDVLEELAATAHSVAVPQERFNVDGSWRRGFVLPMPTASSLHDELRRAEKHFARVRAMEEVDTERRRRTWRQAWSERYARLRLDPEYVRKNRERAKAWRLAHKASGRPMSPEKPREQLREEWSKRSLKYYRKKRADPAFMEKERARKRAAYARSK